jgi:hypothetical protein
MSIHPNEILVHRPRGLWINGSGAERASVSNWNTQGVSAVREWSMKRPISMKLGNTEYDDANRHMFRLKNQDIPRLE